MQKKKLLKAFTFFSLHKNIPASIILEIINLFLIIRLNAKQIQTKLSSNHKKCISYATICNILFNIRRVIADYLKHEYRIKQIGGDPSLNKIVAIDESLFLHDETGKQIQLVGALDTETNELRLDIVKERTSENLKTFVYNHIIPGTLIVHDGWRSYSFLDDDDSVYTHEEYNQTHGNFGRGSHSTSNIERCWNWIKSEIKFLYRIIPHEHYIFFIRECEYRFNTSKMTNKQKEKNFCKILKYVYKLNSFNFYNEEELLDFNNYDI